MKAVVATFNQTKALVWAFSVIQTSRRCLQWSSQYRVVSEESAGGPGSLDLHHAQGLGQPPLQLLPAASADHLAEDLHNTTSYCYYLYVLDYNSFLHS